MVQSIAEFELRKNIVKALKNGRYLITITMFNEEKNQLDHFHIWQDFPTEDLIPALSHIATAIEAENAPVNT